MNKFLPRCAPIWGFPAHMTIADLPRSYQTEKVPVIENVLNGADQTSAEIKIGARGIELLVECETPAITCDLALIKVTADGDETVRTWAGVKNGDALYAGNLEMVDLDGLPFKVAVTNVSAGWASVYARVTQ